MAPISQALTHARSFDHGYDGNLPFTQLPQSGLIGNFRWEQKMQPEDSLSEALHGAGVDMLFAFGCCAVVAAITVVADTIALARRRHSRRTFRSCYEAWAAYRRIPRP